jgi:intracellular sulfur oxidation DsrE/DsrF family protein
MEKMNAVSRFFIVLLTGILLTLPVVSQASGWNHSRYFEHTAGKAFFDINSSLLDEQSLLFVLGGIKVTYEELEEQGVTPDFIVTFRGLNTGILNDANAGDEVHMLVAALKDMGVKLEVCSKAIYLSGENADDVMEEFDIIDNAWISSMFSQNKRNGYAYITF